MSADAPGFPGRGSSATHVRVQPRDILLALFGMAIWGLNFAVAKLALAELPPILLTALRFTLVAAVLLPVSGPPTRLGHLTGLAVTLGIFHFPFIFSGLRLLDASTAAIVMQLQVPFGAIMAALVLGDRIGPRGLLGMAIAFLGVIFIAGAPRLEASRVGLAYLLVAAMAWGASNVQLKKMGAIDPTTLNGWVGLIAAIELFTISGWIEGPPWQHIASAGWKGWAGVAYTGLVSTIVGYRLWARTIARYSVSQASPFLLTIPLFAVLSGMLLNGDRPTADVAVGGLLTIAGVGLTLVRRPRVEAIAETAV
jgi:O-acetylserine/cysteine efflux transporter